MNTSPFGLETVVYLFADKNTAEKVLNHHKKVQVTDIHFGPKMDVRHFGYTLTSKLNQLDIHFQI
jgi:hypothetical protein